MLKSESNQQLIDMLMQENSEFCKLYNDHVKFEQDLEALYSVKYMPDEVENVIKEIKILKLRGKDRMLKIMTSYK